MSVTQFPCFLCGEPRAVKISIKSKPYFICDPCGVQAFIRKDAGIERLQTVGAVMQAVPVPFKRKNKVLGLIELIRILQKEQKDLEDKDGIKELLIPDESREIQKAALQSEIHKAEARLKKLIQ
jgi:hypothetical protein